MRFRNGDAAMRRFAGGDDLVGRVQQCLRRNAAAIQADAAQPLVAFDEDDFFAQVRRIKRRRITARSRADDDNFSFDGDP